MIIAISRPRFWLYLAGPYAVGMLSGAPTLSNVFQWQYALLCIYFLIPANILLYGINDLFDTDTDQFNQKKDKKEHRLKQSEQKYLQRYIWVLIFASVGSIYFLQNVLSQIIFALFLFLAIFYSTPPLRFKSKPIIDSASNILYALPGFLGYAQITGSLPPLLVILAAWCWTAAMHLFSAIPDIESDKKAGLKTTAIVMGKKKSLLVCTIIWLIANSVFFMHGWWLLAVVGFIYPLSPFVLLQCNKDNIEKFYWYFPIINTLFGALLTVVIVLKKT